jgi:ATP dependent DNA ligase domain
MAKSLPAGFIIPAQPLMASKPPSGADWVHEIKHDDYRLIVRRDGPTVRFYTRNACDWTARLPAIAAAAARIKAKSFTIDGEAVVLGSSAQSTRMQSECPSGNTSTDSYRPRIAGHFSAHNMLDRPTSYWPCRNL